MNAQGIGIKLGIFGRNQYCEGLYYYRIRGTFFHESVEFDLQVIIAQYNFRKNNNISCHYLKV